MLIPVSDSETTTPVSDAQQVTKGMKKRFLVINHGKKAKIQVDASLVTGKVLKEIDSASGNNVSVVEFQTEEQFEEFQGLGYDSSEIEVDQVRFIQRLNDRSKFGSKRDYFHEEIQRHLAANTQVIPYGIKKVFQGNVPDPSYFPSEIRHPICVLDSGINSTHPDLANIKLTSGDGQSTEDCEGLWHGTHVSGTIVAEDNDFGVVGVFPGAPLMFVKLFGGSQCGWDYTAHTYASDLIEAAMNCIQKGAKILSMSLGGLGQSAYEKTMFQEIFEKHEVLLFAASGNSGSSDYLFPASYPSLISVAATDSSDEVAEFSTYNNQVDISAPGVDILSTVGAPAMFPLLVGGEFYPMKYMDYSVRLPAGQDINTQACICEKLSCPSSCNSKLCIMPRGGGSFKEKGSICKGQGGVAAVIYNYAGQSFITGTLEDSTLDIPVFDVSGTVGPLIIQQNLTQAWVITGGDGLPYNVESGTSMATPHASGVAYLLWNKYPDCKNYHIREALESTSKDLGTSGSDNWYGKGLIQYWSAAEYLEGLGCNGPVVEAPAMTPSIRKPSAVPSIVPSVISGLFEPKPDLSILYVKQISYFVKNQSVNVEVVLSSPVANVVVTLTPFKNNQQAGTFSNTTDANGTSDTQVGQANENDLWSTSITGVEIPQGESFYYDETQNFIDVGFIVPGGRKIRH